MSDNRFEGRSSGAVEGDGSQSLSGQFLKWLGRTPVQTFVLCPISVIGFELALHGGAITFVSWGLLLLAWGYLQYFFVGRYRHPRAGGSAGMQNPPDQIVSSGLYRFTRNPMYLGHLIFLLGLAVCFRSWFALILLALRAVWFHGRVLKDEARLERMFGEEYYAYMARVNRWIPMVL